MNTYLGRSTKNAKQMTATSFNHPVVENRPPKLSHFGLKLCKGASSSIHFKKAKLTSQ
jgi:hypothetical protein